MPDSIIAASDFWGTKTPKTPPIKTRTESIKLSSNGGNSLEVDPKNVMSLTKDQAEKADEMIAN